jgi:hypothetical protein
MVNSLIVMMTMDGEIIESNIFFYFKLPFKIFNTFRPGSKTSEVTFPLVKPCR